MAKIYLIRHCESEGNATRRAHAQMDSLITKKGYQQAEALGERFRNERIDAVYSSDTYRSIMTAKAIADLHGVDVKVRFSLREVTTGIWEDESWGNIAGQYPDACDRWMNRPWEADTPGATTFQQAADRVLFCLRRIAREVGPDGAAAVVTHSCSIKSTLCVALGKPMTEVLLLGHGENTSVSCLDIDEAGNISVEYMNDTSHLPANLQRAWGGLAGKSVNMELYPCSSAEQRGQLMELVQKNRQEAGAAFDEAAFCQWVEEKLAADPQSIALGYLNGTACGYICFHTNASASAPGILEELYVIPELQEKGYAEQLFGHMLHVLRYAGKDAVLISGTMTGEAQRMTERFVCCKAQEHPNDWKLDLYTPLYRYRVLA